MGKMKKNEFCISNNYENKIDLIASKFLIIIIVTLIEDYIWIQFQEIIFIYFLEKKIFYKKVAFSLFPDNKRKKSINRPEIVFFRVYNMHIIIINLTFNILRRHQ